MYFVIEGHDGAGKSTVHQMLKKELGEEFLFIKEPYYQVFIDEIMNTEDPIAKALFFAADRVKLMNSIITPAIAKGLHVVSDRSWITSEVYQWAQGADRTYIHSIQPFSRIPNIDHLFVLVCESETAVKRLKKGWDGYQSGSFLNEVKNKYIAFATSEYPNNSTIIHTGSLDAKEVCCMMKSVLTKQLNTI